jgi:hypothetical protein
MTKARPSIPEVLPTSPISLSCPFAKRNPAKTAKQTSGGFALIHLERIKAAVLADKTRKR